MSRDGTSQNSGKSYDFRRTWNLLVQGGWPSGGSHFEGSFAVIISIKSRKCHDLQRNLEFFTRVRWVGFLRVKMSKDCKIVDLQRTL